MSIRTVCAYGVAVSLSVLLGGPAFAAATYSAAATSTFTLTPVAPVSTIVDHLPFTSTTVAGGAVASIDTFSASGAGVHPATIDSKVSGAAAAPPDSLSMAEAKRGHVFEVPRVDAAGALPLVTLAFSFEIFWDVHLALTLPGSEFAAGGAYFAISGFEPGIDSIVLDAGMPGAIVPDGPGFRWEFNPSYFTFGGAVDSTTSTVVTGLITVEAGTVGEFSVITDVAGRALAFQVAAPSTAWTIGFGLLVLLVPVRGRLRNRSRAVTG